MAELSPREPSATRVEHALAAEQVNLTTEHGRARAAELIEEALRALPGRAARRRRRPARRRDCSRRSGASCATT